MQVLLYDISTLVVTKCKNQCIGRKIRDWCMPYRATVSAPKLKGPKVADRHVGEYQIEAIHSSKQYGRLDDRSFLYTILARCWCWGRWYFPRPSLTGKHFVFKYEVLIFSAIFHRAWVQTLEMIEKVPLKYIDINDFPLKIPKTQASVFKASKHWHYQSKGSAEHFPGYSRAQGRHAFRLGVLEPWPYSYYILSPGLIIWCRATL